MAVQKIGISRARHVEDVRRHHAHFRPHPAILARKRVIVGPGVLVVVEVAFALLELVENRVGRHFAEFAQHHDIFAVGLDRIGSGGVDHDRAVMPGLFLQAAMRVPPVGTRLANRKFGGEGLSRFDAGKAHARHSIELKRHEQTVPVDRGIFLELVMDIEPDGRAFLQSQQRTGDRAIDGDRAAAPVAGREGRSGNGEVDIGAGYLVQPLAGVTCEDVRAPCPGRHRPGKAEQTHSSCSGSEKLASIDGDHKGLLTWRLPLLTRAPIQPLKVFRSAPLACCARGIRGFRSPFRSFREDRPPRPGYAPRWSRAQALRAALQAFARSRPERD